MKRSRFLRATVAVALLGGVSVAAWLWSAGGRQHFDVARFQPVHFVALCAVTGFCILLRFVRWQFLLRQIDARVPTRRSISLYLASLLGIATPAYVGELSRAVLAAREARVRLIGPVAVIALERLLDVVVVALIAALASGGRWSLLLGVAALLIAALAGRMIVVFARRHGATTELLRQLMEGRVLLVAAAMSLASWAAAATAVTLAAASVGVHLGLLNGIGVFASATLAGGLSLIPAGIAVTGSLAIVQLRALGIALPDAVLTASAFRLGTVGITLAVASAFAVHEWLVLRQAKRAATEKHFDSIATEYLDQWSPHMWDLLLGRRLKLLLQTLPTPAATSGMGLDLGCGLGQQCQWLNARGYRVIGLDAAHGLLRFARNQNAAVVNGSATALPFDDASLDFIYTIGVLHHLPTRADQAIACAEVARVLKPGGLFIVHETNPRNPLFRFYMGYVFPVLKSIDEGTELWLAPEHWRADKSMQLVHTHYFTFLPDFLPRKLLKAFLAVEAWLERGPLRSYSVHYMAVLQKPAQAGVAEPHRERDVLQTA